MCSKRGAHIDDRQIFTEIYTYLYIGFLLTQDTNPRDVSVYVMLRDRLQQLFDMEDYEGISYTDVQTEIDIIRNKTFPEDN